MDRYLSKDIVELALNRNKMASISGPRQVGKTYLAKNYKSSFKQFIYKNWDESLFRRLWTKTPNLISEQFNHAKSKEEKLLVHDGTHKSKGWKQKMCRC